VASLPPVSTLFAAFLGENPIEHLLGASGLAGLSPDHVATLTGTTFFPEIISEPFHHGLAVVFVAATGMAAAGAGASLLRGRTR
jgi:hypothetical protein